MEDINYLVKHSSFQRRLQFSHHHLISDDLWIEGIHTSYTLILMWNPAPGQWGKVLVPPEQIDITISLSFSTGLRLPPRWKLATWGWVQDSWNTTLLPHHQSIKIKSHTLKPSSYILPVKNFSLKTILEFKFLSSSHLFFSLSPAINVSLLQTLMSPFVWLHWAFGTGTYVQ